ncbi:MAG: Holliday junction DNA helicase RuvA [Pseudohongiellaceae bacterium]
MIGQLRGKLLAKNPPEVLLEVGGVGYEVQVPMSTLYELPDVGREVLLHTHFVVREDAQLLYGFHDLKSKSMFRSLIKVNGVGPKMALGILSGMQADEFVQTVRSNDVSAMIKMPGIGKKTAERLIIEMRDRLDEWGDTSGAVTGGILLTSSVSRDAETALISLGYKPPQAARSIAVVMKEHPEIEDSEALIRLALKSMA